MAAGSLAGGKSEANVCVWRLVGKGGARIFHPAGRSHAPRIVSLSPFPVSEMEFDLPTATAVLERTPLNLQAMLAGLPHTLTSANEGHLAQIARVMAKQYRDAVGPWRTYLPIMDR